MGFTKIEKRKYAVECIGKSQGENEDFSLKNMYIGKIWIA
jgi:hypothetical protein